jgi:hypothetical protein
MAQRLTLLAGCLLATPAAATSPIAEVICAPRGEIVSQLTRLSGATMTGMGLRDVETVMEIWTSPRGDWTLVQSYSDGRACILAMGEAWDMPNHGEKG